MGPIVIALEGPLTGAQSENGIDMLRGARLAAKQMNAAGGLLGRTIKIVAVDDEADPALALDAVTAARKAGAIAVIGPYNSSVGLVNLGDYMDEGIVPMRMTSSNQTEGFGATTQPMISQIAPVEIDFLTSKNVRKVVMLVDPSEYTTQVAHLTAKGLKSKGVKVTKISVVPGKSDYSGAVAQALSANPDVVYSSTYYPEGSKIAEALSAAKSEAKCFMNMSNVDTAFISATGVAIARSCTYSGVPAAGQLPTAQAYVKAYKSTFDARPDVWGAFTYDSALVLFDAIRWTQSTTYDDLLAGVLTTRGVDGATGEINIHRKTGNRAQAPMYIMKVNTKGKFVIR